MKTEITEARVKRLFEKVKKDFESINLFPNGYLYDKVRFMNSKRTLGYCKYHRTVLGINYEISISKHYAEAATDAEIYNTLAHELVHTLKDGQGHGRVFKRYASYVNERLGTDIRRMVDTSELSLGAQENIRLKREVNYIIDCNGCGQRIERQNFSKTIQYPERYICGICGGNFTRIK